jgi:hypothetical protein
MVWKKILKPRQNKENYKKKSKIRSGKNGKKTKKKDLMRFKRKLKKFIKKMTKSGTILMPKSKVIGNKNIMLTLFSGKWKLKQEKSTISKERKEEKCIKKKIKKDKKNNNFKNILVKSNFAIS